MASTEPVIIGDATRITAIYALCEFPSWEPRYVGKTVQYIIDRRKAHITAAKRGGRLPIHYWLRKKIANGESIALKLLEHVRPPDDWKARECYWIEHFRNAGHALLNLTDGGEGLAGHKFSSEHTAKIAAALRTGAERNCQRCGKSFWGKRSQIVRGQAKFCSRKCSNHRHMLPGLFDAS